MCFLNKVLSLAVSQPKKLSTPVYLLHESLSLSFNNKNLEVNSKTYELTFFLSTLVFVRRAREEQLWEQQRIVTQLKRNLRHAKSVKTVQEQDYEEELNFSLQTPAVPVPEPQQQMSIVDTKQQIASKTGVHQQQEVPHAAAQQQQLGAGQSCNEDLRRFWRSVL